MDKNINKQKTEPVKYSVHSSLKCFKAFFLCQSGGIKCWIVNNILCGKKLTVKYLYCKNALLLTVK